MDDYKLLGYVAKEIDKLRNDNVAFLGAGRAINYDEYRNVCGIIRGLSLAESIINDLVQRLERHENE
jgi:hypothetical protein